jgi:hypothetical protein
MSGFSFQINYPVLRYIAVCAGALVGALTGAVLSGGDVTYILLFGAGFYIIGEIIVWVNYRSG